MLLPLLLISSAEGTESGSIVDDEISSALISVAMAEVRVVRNGNTNDENDINGCGKNDYVRNENKENVSFNGENRDKNEGSNKNDSVRNENECEVIDEVLDKLVETFGNLIYVFTGLNMAENDANIAYTPPYAPEYSLLYVRGIISRICFGAAKVQGRPCL